MKPFLPGAFSLAAAIPANAQNVGVSTTSPTYGCLEIVAPSGNQLITRTAATGPGLSHLVVSGAPTLGFNLMLNGSYSSMGKGYSSFFTYDTAEG